MTREKSDSPLLVRLNQYHQLHNPIHHTEHHDPQQTKKILVSTRTNATINRLEKTRTIHPADELPAAKDAYLKEQRREKRKEAEKLKKEEDRVLNERRMEKEEKERAWEELQRGEGGKSNEEGFDEDDFM